jgi:hypothetical protein
VEHPVPTKDQPFKKIKYITDLGQYDIEHLAALMNKAPLKATDQFFIQIRARISLLDRSVHTTSRAGRIWHRYCPLQPHRRSAAADDLAGLLQFLQARPRQEDAGDAPRLGPDADRPWSPHQLPAGGDV